MLDAEKKRTMNTTKTKTTYTPGPWKIEKIVHLSGTSHCITTHEDPEHNRTLITSLSVIDGHCENANARLIAAAPELLAACKLASLVCSKEYLSKQDRFEALDIIRAAISKTEGKL